MTADIPNVGVRLGFIALLGIATDHDDDASYLDQSFRNLRSTTKQEIRKATVQAGLRRSRPGLMTAATTILALIPELTSMARILAVDT